MTRLPVGQVYVVAVSAEAACVARLERVERETPGEPRMEIGPVAVERWRHATRLLPEVLPAIVRALPRPLGHDERPLVLEKGSVVVGPRRGAQDPTRIEGPSAGAAWLLAQVSECIEVGVPANLVVSACLESEGRLSGVEGLEFKLEAWLEFTAGRSDGTVFVVHVDQVELVKAFLDRRKETRVAVEGVRDASELLGHAFGEALETYVDRAASDPARRARTTTWLFETALAGRTALMKWTPLAEATERLLKRSMPPAEALQLEVARAIALRHEDHPCDFPEVDAALIDTLEFEDRVRLAQNALQHDADFGGLPESAEQHLVAPFAVETAAKALADKPAEVLRLLGAHARRRAAYGFLREALELQGSLSRSWAMRRRPDEQTYPLAERLRLGGALEDTTAYDNAYAEWDVVRNAPSVTEGARAITEVFAFRGFSLLSKDFDAIHAMSERWRADFEGLRLPHVAIVLRSLGESALRAGRHEVVAHVRAKLTAEKAKSSSGRPSLAAQCLVLLDCAQGIDGALAELRGVRAWAARFNRLYDALDNASHDERVTFALRAWPY